jgi:excisionase family DNA binding protein
MSSLLTVRQAATLLGVSRWTLYRAIEQGSIRHVRLGPQTVRFRVEDLEALVRARTVEPIAAGA